MKRSFFTQLTLALMLLVLAGCGPLNFGLNSRALTITVNLDETMLNRILTQAQDSIVAVNGDVLFGEITNIDFQAPDTIRALWDTQPRGQHDRRQL
ncbi:MAG: hypothetical protein R3E79_51200 [Caldilineaceae bacterium]